MGDPKRCLRFHLPSDSAKTYYEARASDIEEVVLCVLRGVLTERPACDLRQWVADWCHTDAFLQGGAGAGAAPDAHGEAGSAEPDEAIPTVGREACFSRCEDWGAGLFARMWTGSYHPPAAASTRLRVRRSGKVERACAAEARRLGIPPPPLPSAEAEAEEEAQACACVIEELHTACCDADELAVLRTEVFPRVWRMGQHPCLQEFWGFAEGSGGGGCSLYAVSAAPGYVSAAAWGQTLAARRERASLLQVHRLVLQAAAALQFLHAHGVVHGGVEAECIFLASPDAERFVLWDSGARAAFDARRRQSGGTPLLSPREQERAAEAQRWRECPAEGGGGGVSPGNDVLRLGHVVAHVCRYCEGPLSVARPPACPEDFWDVCVLPCFEGETAAGAVRAAAEGFDSVRTADDAAAGRAAFGGLMLPLPGDRLSFIRYNVPHLRRTVALRLAAAAGGTARVDLTELCKASAAHVAAPSLSTALLETARAVVASRGHSVSALFLSRGTAAAAAPSADASPAFPWRLPPAPDEAEEACAEEKLYAAVAGAAAGCEALHTLALGGLVVPPAQLEDFLGALAGSPAMVSLAYCEAPVVPPGGGGGGVRLPPELLLRGLKELRLAGCGLCDAQVVEAFGGLLRAAAAGEDRLEALDVSRNRLGPASGLLLAEGVACSRTMASLCLARNRFGDETARAFAAALRENDSVECFDMRHNGLTLGSVAELTRTLQGRPHISLYKTEGMFSFVRGGGVEEGCHAC